MHKMRIFVILQNFPGGMTPDPLEWSCLRHFP